MSRRIVPVAVLVLLLAASWPSLANEPDVRVARVSYTDGDVSYARGDSDGWNALVPNTPLVAGDSLYTADGGRAEIHLGAGSGVFRMDAGTQVDLVAGTADLAQIGVRSGYVSLRAAALAPGATLEVDTPGGAATVLTPGVFRFEVTSDGARFSAVKGRLSVALGSQQLDVDAGERLTLRGSNDQSYGFDHIDPENAFDRWAYERDLRAQRSMSARYVHPDVVGSEDLDDHGTWRASAEYGRVWTPNNVPAAWAPYQAGRWIWQDPYGWTWVSDEPWGWAPYHYGRWVYTDNTWGWVPPPPVGFHGPSVVAEIRPSYAPALVAFVGGSSWSVGVSIGGAPSIGWVPLAPHEHYYYPWQPAPHVTNNYTNITVVNAVTIVNTTTFASGPVHPIHVKHEEIERAPVIGTWTPVAPTRESLCVSLQRDPHSSYVPRHDERTLVVRSAPPPRPVPFEEKVGEIHRTGRPFEGHDRGEHRGPIAASVPPAYRVVTARPVAAGGSQQPGERDHAYPAHAERPPEVTDHRGNPHRQEVTWETRHDAPRTAAPATTEHIGASQRTETPETLHSRAHGPEPVERTATTSEPPNPHRERAVPVPAPAEPHVEPLRHAEHVAPAAAATASSPSQHSSHAQQAAQNNAAKKSEKGKEKAEHGHDHE